MADRSGRPQSSGLAFAFTAPAFLVMGIMVLYPFVFNVVISFSNMSLTHFRDWSLIGPKNYFQVLTDGAFGVTLLKTDFPLMFLFRTRASETPISTWKNTLTTVHSTVLNRV